MLHGLACEAGVLSTMFARNRFDKLEAKDLTVKIKLYKQVSVREAASAVDIAGGQGFLKCNCSGNCSKLNCKCQKKKVLCNSRWKFENKIIFLIILIFSKSFHNNFVISQSNLSIEI
jgi:hypothetical protein